MESVGCTVFHIGGGKAVTAGHCFLPSGGEKTRIECVGEIQWGVHQADTTRPANIETSACTMVERVRDSNDVDFAVIRVDPPPSFSLHLTSKAALRGLPIQILGYPDGPPISYPANGCALHPGGDTSLDELRNKPWIIAYKCDTNLGSSGSPVFRTDDWTVLAVHHGGALTNPTNNDGWNWATAADQVEAAL
jgi:V8-like Glu-specific endopeptidase